MQGYMSMQGEWRLAHIRSHEDDTMEGIYHAQLKKFLENNI